MENKYEVSKEKKTFDTSVSYFKLYKFSSPLEKLLLVVAIICGIMAGIAEAFFFYHYGKCIGAITSFQRDWFKAGYDKDERTRVEKIFNDQTNEFAFVVIITTMLIFGNLYVSTFLFNYTAMRQTFRIRQLYFSKVIYQDISWHDQSPTGDFASRLADDLGKFEDGINDKAALVLYTSTVAIASAVEALIIGWEMALVGLVTIPISFLLMSLIGKFTSKMAKIEAEAYGEAAKIADETLTYIKTVVAFDGQKQELERYKKWLLVAKDSNVKKHLLSGFLEGVVHFFMYLTSAIFIWYGIKLITRDKSIEGGYDIAMFTTITYCVISVTANAGNVAPFLQGFHRARGAAHKIFSVIQDCSVINQSYSEGIKINHLDGNISFRNVSFSYPARKEVMVLKNLNLEIKAGETVALVGSSGCGKSTIVQLIQRFYDPTHGNIYVDDNKKLTELNLVSLRNHVGMVSQEPVLFNATIEENIRLGNLEATRLEIEEAAKKSDAHSFIIAFPKGYQTVVGERGAQLSGGQKQRIAIARALVRKPSILLLDEATSALDSKSEALVQATIDKISQECTTIIVAHRLSTVRKADRILVMEDGGVVEEGTHEDLMLLKRAYHNLVVSQLSSADGQEENNTPNPVLELKDEEEANNTTDDVEPNKLVEKLITFSTFWNIMVDSLVPRWCVLAGVTFSIVGGLSCMVYSLIFGKSFAALSDPAADHASFQANFYGISYLVMAVVIFLSCVLQFYFLGIAGENLIVTLRSSMFQTMILQKIEWFDRSENGVGALNARLSAEPSSIQNAINFCARPLLKIISMAMFLVCASYNWCAKVLMVMSFYVPLLAVMLYVEHKVLVREKQKNGAALRESTMMAVEAINNIRTVASLSIESFFERCFTTKLQASRKLTVASFHIQSAVFGFAKSVAILSYIITVYYGSFFIKSKEIDSTAIIALALMFAFFLWNSMLTLALMSNLVGGFVACDQIKKLLDLCPKDEDLKEDENVTVSGGDVEYQNVSFTYPTRLDIPILRGLDLKAFKGKTIALVGSSGCGKSTIVQLLERFYDADSGKITYGEEDIGQMDLKALKSQLAIVTQEPCIFSRTIGENIAYGLPNRDDLEEKIIEAAKKANIHSFVANLPLGYDTVLGEKGTQLSGGQKQRIAIARAVIRKPEVLLLDEATSALDAESEKVVQEALNNAREETTCIVIAHRLATIIDADVIAVLDKGNIAELGTHQELMEKKGLYRKFYNMQHLQ